MIDLNPSSMIHSEADSLRLGKAAMLYATKIGLAVFPLMPRDKPPLDLCDECMARLPGYAPQADHKSCRKCGAIYEKSQPRGFHIATRDVAVIERWWGAAPDANIGLPTGNGLLVLDIDGEEAEKSLAALTAIHGPLPPTPEQFTGKGRHLFFNIPGAVKCSSSQLGEKLDIRADGGYVAVAPSMHPNGNRYRFVEGRKLSDLPRAPAPEWLLAKLAKPKAKERTSTGSQRPDTGSISEAYVRRAVDGEYQRIATAPSGRRNEAINQGAFSLGQLVGAGALSLVLARQTLEAAADACGALAEERHKTLDTISRGLAAGMAEPRDLSDIGRAGHDWQERKERQAEHGAPPHGDPEQAPPPPPPELDPLPIATAWAGVDPASIPRRRWLYGRYLCRGILSVTVSPGGVGKSSLALVEALQMAAGLKLHDQALPDGAARVWYINLEDPPDELDRRTAGACLHYGIKYSELAGRLFINSGVDTPLKLAGLTAKGQSQLDEAAFDHVEQQIRANSIDAIIVDPFVSSHDLPESDNGMIDRLAKRWSRLAMRCSVAVGLVHHTKKLAPGVEHDADSARGASALINAARVVRVLNPMTKDEAETANIRPELRRLYFRASRDKQNLAPPDADKNWYRMMGVNLGNGTPPAHVDADEVGVATRWEWTDPIDMVPPGTLAEVQQAISAREYGAATQADDWVGKLVAHVLRISPTDNVGIAQVKRILSRWEANGALRREEVYCQKRRRVRPVMRVGKLEDCANAQ